MLSILLSRLIVLVVGTLYPAYRSYKAIRTKDVKEYVKWMMYWIVLALYTLGEAVADTLLSFWFPFYYEIKVIFVLWLLSPWTKGASILYRKWVHPLFLKHEGDIDGFLDQAKSESYRQVLTLGNRGLMCAKDIVATAALRSMGQAQFGQNVHRSFSMNDVSDQKQRGGTMTTRLVDLVNLTQSHPAADTQSLFELAEETDIVEVENEQQPEQREQEEVRTWTGYYDESTNQIVEREIKIKQTRTMIDNEEMILIEDPHETTPPAPSGQKRQARRRNSRSRSRTGTIGIDETDSSSTYGTLPRRSQRRTGGP